MKYEVIDKKGRVLGLYLETEEDLWLLYTLLRPGDLVTMRSLREVSVGGSGEARRVPMVLTVEVRSMEFQPFTNRLRVRGIVKRGPEEYGIQGKHHTLAVEPGSYLEVYREEGWSRLDLKRLEKRAEKTVRVLVVSVDDDEWCVAEYSFSGVRVLRSVSVPRRAKMQGLESEEPERALLEEARSLRDLLARGSYASILVVGPGIWVERAVRVLREALGEKVRLVTESWPHGGLKAVMDLESMGTVRRLLSESSAALAAEVLEEALARLARGDSRVAIGLEESLRASEVGSVDRLVLVDELLATYDVRLRESVERLLRVVDERGGEIVIVPSKTIIGERLAQLGGVIALLRFGVPRDDLGEV